MANASTEEASLSPPGMSMTSSNDSDSPITLPPTATTTPSNTINCTFDENGGVRACYDCLNKPELSGKCGIDPEGSCVDVVHRPLLTNIFTSKQFTYCPFTDVTCANCHMAWQYFDHARASYCIGEGGCICTQACETSHMATPEASTSGSGDAYDAVRGSHSAAYFIGSGSESPGTLHDPPTRKLDGYTWFMSVFSIAVLGLLIIILFVILYMRRRQLQSRFRQAWNYLCGKSRRSSDRDKLPHLTLGGWRAYHSKLIMDEQREGANRSIPIQVASPDEVLRVTSSPNLVSNSPLSQSDTPYQDRASV